MQLPTSILTALILGVTLNYTLPAASKPLSFSQSQLPVKYAGLFHTLDVLEDVDDALSGNIGQIDPIRNVTRSVEDAVDDVSDTIRDVKDFKIYEPFTDIDDRVEDFNDNVSDTIRHVSDDVNDWFD